MAKSSRKFAAQAELLAASVQQLYIASVRKGIEEGFKAAVENTVQDSSNAAAHWMIGVGGRGNVYSRKFGKLGDFRDGGDALVGSRRDGRDSTAQAASVVGAVVEREMTKVVSEYVKGYTPSLDFFFYNAVASNPTYDGRAGVSDAGKFAVQQAMAHFEKQIAAGNVRVRRRGQ